MGNCVNTNDRLDPTIAVNLSEFELKHLIGQGGSGRVWKVIHKKSHMKYAMKEMSKALIISKYSDSSIMNERKLLGIMRHPFIVNLHYAFQTKDTLYLVLDFMPGGDFKYYLANRKPLDEESIKFLAACIITALEFLHSNQIVHRDIKPANLVLNEKGYVHLTDFGVATMASTNNSSNTSGTLGYMAPEVICNQDHGIVADYFALGVVLYECITYTQPYIGKTKKEMREAVLNNQVQLKLETGSVWSDQLINFINKLIQRKPENRLGFHGPEELKNHIFFKEFDWVSLYKKEMKSPFVVSEADNFDSFLLPSQEVKNVSQKNYEKHFAGFLYDESIFLLPKNQNPRFLNK